MRKASCIICAVVYGGGVKMRKMVSAIIMVVLRYVVVHNAMNTADAHAHAHSVCQTTLYPELCVLTLNGRGQREGMSVKEVGTACVEASIEELMAASQSIEDCRSLFQSSARHLNASLLLLRYSTHFNTQDADDVKTWLSASLTDLDTCEQPFPEELISARVTKLVSISLAIVNSIPLPDEPCNIIHRRLLSEPLFPLKDGFPSWISAAERRLLQSNYPAAADVVVAKDGSGNYKTITEAVEGAPSKGDGRYVIHVKAGVYNERVLVAKDNIVLIGDGKDVTIVTASKSGPSLNSIPTFAVTGKGFIARDIGFENTAGENKGQAIALRAASDQSVYYRCSLKSYQDTLYAYSLRQFYRECDIYGSVDFIFGNAAAVFQRCNIISSERGGGSANYITAQGRSDPNQNTGFSIDECKVTGSMHTYLGRPWRPYSRTVFMQSYLDGSIDPAGWADWPGTSSRQTVYYGEYMNNGPGAGTGKRVQWPGYHIISTTIEASKFTVSQLISGNSWLPSTGVSFRPGLIS